MAAMSNKDRVQADLDRRRSNAARPIPAARYKQPRSGVKQQLKESYR